MLKKRIMLILSLIVPLGVGIIASILTSDAMEEFSELKKPFLAPPAILFPIVWSLLYLSMGYAIYRVMMKDGSGMIKASSLIVYIAQLTLNFAWSLIFFGADMYVVAFIVLMIMWVLIICMAILYKKVSKLSFFLTIPYIVWVTFAAYLNLGVAILN